jgi:hypothetical protein
MLKLTDITPNLEAAHPKYTISVIQTRDRFDPQANAIVDTPISAMVLNNGEIQELIKFLRGAAYID